jgi:signal transduction histidine kinase
MDNEPSPKQETAQAIHGLRGASMEQKGLWTLVGLIAYFCLVTLVVTLERNSLWQSVRELELAHQSEERQITLNLTVNRAIQAVNENYFAPNVEASAQSLGLEVEAVLSSLRKLAPSYPILADDVAALEQIEHAIATQPSRAAIAETRSTLHRLVIDLDTVTTDLRNRKQRLLNDYRETYSRVTIEWVIFMIVGIGVFGGLGLMFFRHLAKDINTVRARAMDIVRGYRGAPLPVERGDEMGSLIAAVNVMQRELRERETQIELRRQQQIHKEKMAAVGSLAAAVAHEINNPLAAIVGIAEAVRGEQTARNCTRQGSTCQPDLILDQARRVMQITRQIGEFSVPQSPEPALITLNGLVRSTCGFVSFDHRFRHIDLVQDLDPQLPAVVAVADHLVQILMNLLINAADAFDGNANRSPCIEVSTATEGNEVVLQINDNGAGISPELLDRIFDEHFTTKPPGRGSGLGLALCRTLIERAAGRISLDSEPGRGTRVTVRMPIPDATALST